MKTIILIGTIASVLFSQNIFDAQILRAQTTDKPPTINASSTAGNSPSKVTQSTAVQTQLSGASGPPAQSLPIIAPPADIASLTAKEILAANNQVVSQVASMYQNFGLWLTIIVTLVGGIATWLSFMAKKSVEDFIKEWTKKMELIESEMKNSLTRLRDTESAAERSAKKAAEHAQSSEETMVVLTKTLQDLDRLKANVASLRAQDVGEQQDVSPPSTDAGVISPPSQPPATDEDAEVSARLQGKLNSTEGEG